LSDWYAVERVRCWVDVYCIKGTELDGQQSAKRNREQRRNGFHNIRSVVTSSKETRAGEQQRGQQETSHNRENKGNIPQQREQEQPTTGTSRVSAASEGPLGFFKCLSAASLFER
jgi:hypothetical protein